MSEALDPNRYHIVGPITKKKFIIAGLLVVFILLPAFLVYYYNLAIHRPSQMDKEITFEIKSGESTPEIATNLMQKNAINSEFLFSLYVFINKLDRNIQAGAYTIPVGTSLVDLVEAFQHGTKDVKLTFIEGWRMEQYGLLAAGKLGKVGYNDFVNKASEFEGYLFPDTYYFNEETQEDALINKLRETFDTKTKDLFTSDKLQKSGLTREQVVILASIVEREANKEEDRPIVAGVLIARFKQGLRLDADATTQYAVVPMYLCTISPPNSFCAPALEELTGFNWWQKNLSQADLEFDSKYNTRKYEGLPPRPISNPSLSAIKAVIDYRESDYLYYLTDKAGVTHYAKTLEEHDTNVAKFLQ